MRQPWRPENNNNNNNNNNNTVCTYRLQIHLDRLFASAKAARLPLPYGPDEAVNRKKMVEIVRAVCKASGKQTPKLPTIEASLDFIESADV